MQNRLSQWTYRKFGAVAHETPNSTLFRNDNRVAQSIYRLSSYRRLGWHMWRRGVSAKDIIRTQLPQLESHPPAPALVSLEFTNRCDLRCVYCTSPLGLRPRGMMSAEVFGRVLEGLRDASGQQGSGSSGMENQRCTRNSPSSLRRCAVASRPVSVLTNGQWRRPARTIEALLGPRVGMVEVSVDGADAMAYEKSRPGGKLPPATCEFDGPQRAAQRSRHADHYQYPTHAPPIGENRGA